MAIDLRARFIALAGTTHQAVYDDEIAPRYQEPHRHYHTLAHLAACLEIADTHVARDFRERAALELALYFHDVIYDTHAHDNEGASRALLLSLPLHLPFQQLAADAILATRHTALPNADDLLATTLVDVDLSILGAPPALFNAYEAQVRAEYAWVPEPAFRHARADVLRGFLDRPRIFMTDTFFESFESTARVNLAASLTRHSSP